MTAHDRPGLHPSMTHLRILLLLLPLALSCGSEPVASDGDNVVLIIIDTLRSDHMGFYGYRRDITPSLDSLARAGTVWMNCQAQSSWTLPSVASILTGLTPREHGAGSIRGRMFGLSGNIPTLTTIMHSRGYATCGIFNVVFLSEEFGFHRGFDHFDCRGVTGNRGTRRAGETVDAAIRWLEELDAPPFLAVVHLYDPHIPYDPPPPYDTLFADPLIRDLRIGSAQIDTMQAVNNGRVVLSDSGLSAMEDLYDGEIAYTDAQLSRFFGYLRTSGLAGNTLVVVLSDHGEEFMEHGGIEHGRTLYQEVVHVPLILSGPGVPAGVRMSAACAQIDILPTVLSFLGTEPPEGRSGVDLLEEDSVHRYLPSSNLLWSNRLQASVRNGNLKTIWYAESGETESYDLSEDPREQSPLAVTDSAMVREAEYYWSTPCLADPPEVSFEDAENSQLRDLGYIR